MTDMAFECKKPKRTSTPTLHRAQAVQLQNLSARRNAATAKTMGTNYHCFLVLCDILNSFLLIKTTKYRVEKDCLTCPISEILGMYPEA